MYLNLTKTYKHMNTHVPDRNDGIHALPRVGAGHRKNTPLGAEELGDSDISKVCLTCAYIQLHDGMISLLLRRWD